MRYKRLTALLAVAISSICIYYLSFTFIARKLELDATRHATNKKGQIDYTKKQVYLNKNPVFRIFGKEIAYEYARDRKIELGLDLQEGMYITLEIDTFAILQEMAGSEGRKASFRNILAAAKEAYQKEPSKSPVDCFVEAYKRVYGESRLNALFFRDEHGLSNEAVIKRIKEDIKEKRDRTQVVIDKRLNGPGLGGAVVRSSPQEGSMDIEVPGITSMDPILKLINSTAELRFYSLVSQEEARDIMTMIKEVEKESNLKGRSKKLSNILIQSNNRFFCRPEDIQDVRGLLTDNNLVEKLASLRYVLIAIADADEASAPKNEEGRSYYTIYALQTGDDGQGLMPLKSIIKEAHSQRHEGQNKIFMEMTKEATKKWATVTGAHINEQIAIVMKGLSTDAGKFDVVISAPVVRSQINQSTSYIEGSYSEEEAQRVASLLDSGSKPAPSNVTSATITQPSIGEAEKDRASFVFLLVLLLIIFFMIFYYAKAGIIASLALLLNMLFILGTMAQLHASLSLAGIAGMLLTFGMSVDANVMTFEETRRRLSQGIYLTRAVQGAFERVFTSIFDGSMTTLLIGVILYLMGQGPIKGFATTLVIGIISSLFTSVMVARLLIESIGPQRFNFGFSFTQNLFDNIRIDFFKHRKKAYLISFTIITAGLGSLYYHGGISKSLGVEFTGGRQIVMKFAKVVSPQSVKSHVSNDLDKASVEAKTFGNNQTIKIITNYRIDDKTQKATKETRAKIIKSLENLTKMTFVKDAKELKPHEFTLVTSTVVSASVADYVMKMAIYAILLALLMIFGYILLRFRRWQFGLSAVLALVHDTLMIFAGLGLARNFGIVYEIDQVFVGAVLTVIGYSINDTVVIFDYFRGKVITMPNSSFKEVANASIVETLSRTLITSFTTFISVFVLFLFGGEALRGFSSALMIGILVGTVSSMFSIVFADDLEKGANYLMNWRKRRRAVN
ncbi:MAG: protein translocase subunit SecD [Bacteroidota bacterium]